MPVVAIACTLLRNPVRDVVDVFDRQLSNTMIAFVGVPGRLDPRSNRERLAEAVPGVTSDLLTRVESILDHLYAAEPPVQDAATITEMSHQVRA